MNNPEIHNPDLQSLELRLGAIPLRLAPDDQQRMLYECAFAAGQRIVQRTVRVWQVASAVMGLILAFVTVPFAPDHSIVHLNEPQSAAILEHSPPELPKSEASFSGGRRSVTVKIDAWQLPASADNVWGQQLAQSRQSDRPTGSSTMGEMLRSHSF